MHASCLWIVLREPCSKLSLGVPQTVSSTQLLLSQDNHLSDPCVAHTTQAPCAEEQSLLVIRKSKTINVEMAI